MPKPLENPPSEAQNGLASEEASDDGGVNATIALTNADDEDIDMADRKCSKSPCFQFYPTDFLSDEHVRLMSLQECGAYIRLLCFCWNEGSLPVEAVKLAKLVGVPLATFRKLWPAIAPCFKAKGDNRLVNGRLDRERRKQREWREGQSKRGKHGAEARWRKHADAMPTPSGNNGHAIDLPMAKNGSSSSSLFSSSKTHVRTRALADEPEELTERAGRFVRETYPALYAQHRKGARYLSKPHFDFLEAVELCRVWDDTRLEKLAAIFLLTDNEFAEKGSRTMAQFRAMASWCDSQLAEVEARRA